MPVHPCSFDYPLPDAVQKNPVAMHISPREVAPLCLFHDGSGQVSMYMRPRGHDRSAYAFFDPHFGTEQRPHNSIDQMAKYYISLLPKSRRSP